MEKAADWRLFYFLEGMVLSLRDRISAALLHLAGSTLILGLVATLLLMFWYPYPLAELSGGLRMLTLLVCVDVALGPLLTLFIFNRKKHYVELRRDIAMVLGLQVAALAYGLWMAFQARPIYIVFEYYQFRIVHASDIDSSTRLSVKNLPWRGPEPLSLKAVPADQREHMLFAELSGVPLAAQPSLWQPYELAANDVKIRARPLNEVAVSHPEIWHTIRDSEQNIEGVASSMVGCLPVIGRNNQFATALVSLVDGRLLRIVPVDYLVQ